MNIEQTIQTLAVLQTGYPQFYRGFSSQEIEDTIKLWAQMFADEDFEVVKTAVLFYIANDVKGFPPHIGAIKEAIRQVSQSDQLSDVEAWQCVMKAMRNSGYHSGEEFEKLPPMVRQAVGSPAQLRAWALMDQDTAQSVVQSNFLRAFQSLKKQEAQQNALPQKARKQLEKQKVSYQLPSEGLSR